MKQKLKSRGKVIVLYNRSIYRWLEGHMCGLQYTNQIHNVNKILRALEHSKILRNIEGFVEVDKIN